MIPTTPEGGITDKTDHKKCKGTAQMTLADGLYLDIYGRHQRITVNQSCVCIPRTGFGSVRWRSNIRISLKPSFSQDSGQ